jgi:hypothetical protein
MRFIKSIVTVVFAVSSIVAFGQESARTVQYHSQDTRTAAAQYEPYSQPGHKTRTASAPGPPCARAPLPPSP